MDFLDYSMILGTLAVTIYAEMHTRSLLLTILVAMGCALLHLLVHMNRKLRRRKRSDKLTEDSRRLRQSKNYLVRLLAENRYAKTKSFLSDLTNGSVTVSDPLEVHDILHCGYCEDPSVTRIQATSSGELDEWSYSPSWLEKGIPAMNKLAVNQGKKITRILILRPTEQLVHAESAVVANSGVGVDVKLVHQEELPAQDLKLANNCLIFCDSRRALYAIRAIHDDGQLTYIDLSTTNEKIQPISDAFRRIDAAARDYDSIKQVTLTNGEDRKTK
jgi:hypothetical protein